MGHPFQRSAIGRAPVEAQDAVDPARIEAVIGPLPPLVDRPLQLPQGIAGFSAMRIHQEKLTVQTPGAGLIDVTVQIAQVVKASGIVTGLATIFVQHTSASLVIQENASADVRSDLALWMSELAPESRRWKHDDEGPDDMPAHARSAITRTSEQVPISGGKLALGTWQAVYLWEHRRRPHGRNLVVHLAGMG